MITQDDKDRAVAFGAVNKVFHSLDRSTWAEKFPEAARELKQYHEDIVLDIQAAIRSGRAKGI